MAKEEAIRLEAKVKEKLPNARFKVELENGHEILAHIQAKCASITFVFSLVTPSPLRCHPMI